MDVQPLVVAGDVQDGGEDRLAVFHDGLGQFGDDVGVEAFGDAAG